MPIFIPDLFSGYLQGRRAAIQDNWTDLKDFNTVLGGQMDNALNLQTMADRARISASNANLTEQAAALGGANTDQLLKQLQLDNLAGLNALNTQARVAQLQHVIRMINDPVYAQRFYALTQQPQTTQPQTSTPSGIPMALEEEPQGIPKEQADEALKIEEEIIGPTISTKNAGRGTGMGPTITY